MKTDDLGKLLLRLTLGVLMLFHGVGKITGDIGYIHRMLATNGLPDWLTYGVYIGEVLGPVLVILGWYSRWGAAFIAANMLFIFAYPHRADLLTLNRSGAWALELEAFYLLIAVAVMLLGPGKYSINRR